MIQVINRAIDIIEYIAREPEAPKSLSDIAASLKLNAGTCANIIKTLVERNYIEKLDNKKGYQLGKRFYQLGNFSGYKKDLIEVAKPIMEQLTKKTQENTLLGILNGNIRIAILQVQSNQDIQAIAADEKIAYQTASGRLLISMLSDTELETFINRYGLPTQDEWNGCTTKKSFLKMVERIRKEGYATQESIRQIIGVAVPIKKQGVVIASLTIYMPSFRFEKAEKETIVKQLMRSASQISQQMDL
jgi:DNA-binding IclR family transcriptional regulator